MKSKVLNIVVWKENSLYVAKFLELELASQGKTVDEAVKNLKEAFSLYFDDNKNNIKVPVINNVSLQTFTLN
jgi:predicted RNase H-like HicB family nuclease